MDIQRFPGEVLDLLPEVRERHAPGDALYVFLKKMARSAVEELFSSVEPLPRAFGEFGDIILPYFSMGAVDSRNLFDIDELIIFSYYLRNRKRYKRAADIGANIGLHSILLSRCIENVRAFEPDPIHYAALKSNLEKNGCRNVETFNCAISSKPGEMEFVRVLGNTTGSHLAGSKSSPYGKLDRFAVQVQGITEVIEWADFIKLDAEGHEANIVVATTERHWEKTDAMIEVENPKNAQILFDHFRSKKVNMFSQKTGWKRAGSLDDLPTNYKEGMLFVTHKDQMPWD